MCRHHHTTYDMIAQHLAERHEGKGNKGMYMDDMRRGHDLLHINTCKYCSLTILWSHDSKVWYDDDDNETCYRVDAPHEPEDK